MKQETIEQTFEAIATLVSLATMAEIQANTARNAEDELKEAQYLSISSEAMDCAHTLYSKVVCLK